MKKLLLALLLSCLPAFGQVTISTTPDETKIVSRPTVNVEVAATESAPGLQTVYVRAWDKSGVQLGFGPAGDVDAERINIYGFSPLILDPAGPITKDVRDDSGKLVTLHYRSDVNEAILQHVEHALKVNPEAKPDTQDKIVPGKIGHTMTVCELSPFVVDGQAERTGVDQTFSAIRTGTGNNASDSAGTFNLRWTGNVTTNNYFEARRAIFIFTCSVPSGDTITSATLSIYGNAKANGLGSPAIYVCAGVSASNTVIAAADYQANINQTCYANIPYASYSISGYNDFTLDAAGIAHINKGASQITKFAALNFWDAQNSTTGLTWVNSASTTFGMVMTETGGGQHPKLTVISTSPYNLPAIRHHMEIQNQ